MLSTFVSPLILLVECGGWGESKFRFDLDGALLYDRKPFHYERWHVIFRMTIKLIYIETIPCHGKRIYQFYFASKLRGDASNANQRCLRQWSLIKST